MSPERAVQEVMARYVRAADSRDADALVALFDANGHERVSNSRNGVRQPVADFQGRDGVRQAVYALLAPHAPGAWAHHTTFDHIITVDGDRASLDAQFILWAIEPGGPPVPELSGYYEWQLVFVDGRWLIADSHIILTVPAEVS